MATADTANPRQVLLALAASTGTSKSSCPPCVMRASPVAQQKRIRLQCRRCKFGPLVGKIPWRKEMATQSSILAWKNPNPWSHKRVRHDWVTKTPALCHELPGPGSGYWRACLSLPQPKLWP